MSAPEPIARLRVLVAKQGVGLGGLGDADRRLALAVPARVLAADTDHDERSVNTLLRASLQAEAAFIDCDHVELRRWLVDTGWWMRDGYGRAYRRLQGAALPEALRPIDAALAGLDLSAWVAELRAGQAAARARRRAAWAQGDRASSAAMDTNPATAATPRASATLVIVRDGADGIEVLLLRRRSRGSDLYSDSWVFPGGALDAADADCRSLCVGVDDTAASARLGLPEGGLDLLAAAVRESFEEAGLLYAVDAAGQLPSLQGDTHARYADWRARLNAGSATLAALCAAEGLRLAVDRFAYIAHWLTPLGLPKRFDTRFFVTEAPAGQVPLHDAGETTELAWWRPADALAQRKALKLALPTQKTLEAVGAHARCAALMDWARGLAGVPLIAPHLGTDQNGKRPVLPDEPAWAELKRIDPAGYGAGRCEIVPGAAVRLSPRVLRVSAGNGSVMTGPGTNTYLVGGGPRNVWAVIDPGPLDAGHVDAILAAAPGPIRWIFATHTHLDHSPACAPLHTRTGAPVHGRIADHPEWQDTQFSPQRLLQGGERIVLDGATLQVVHTPGHASNHLCYLLEEEKTLFTGDHLMQLSTVVINPPDGDMAAYLASLRELLALDLDWLAPGHGFLMAQPRRAIEHVIAHRLKREAKVLSVLRAAAPAGIDTLLPRVYDDVPERMLPVALRSLRAHLFKLRDEGVARERDGLWVAS